MADVKQHALQVGSYLWGKQAALAAAEAELAARKAAKARADEHWADLALQRPANSAHHKTVHVLGKPYHWRQDYTGQLKLAAGESPWVSDVH